MEADVQLIGNDGGQGGFSQAGRAGKQYVVEGLAAGFGGFQSDGELFFCFRLPDKLAQPAGRSLSSKPCSSSARAALTSRSGVLSRAMAMLKKV